MPHVPPRTLDIIDIVIAGSRNHIVKFASHENYPVDGIDLNKLCFLSARLDHAEPLNTEERTAWKAILDETIQDALRAGQTIEHDRD